MRIARSGANFLLEEHEERWGTCAHRGIRECERGIRQWQRTFVFGEVSAARTPIDTCAAFAI